MTNNHFYSSVLCNEVERNFYDPAVFPYSHVFEAMEIVGPIDRNQEGGKRQRNRIEGWRRGKEKRGEMRIRKEKPQADME